MGLGGGWYYSYYCGANVMTALWRECRPRAQGQHHVADLMGFFQKTQRGSWELEVGSWTSELGAKVPGLSDRRPISWRWGSGNW